MAGSLGTTTSSSRVSVASCSSLMGHDVRRLGGKGKPGDEPGKTHVSPPHLQCVLSRLEEPGPAPEAFVSRMLPVFGSM